MSVFAQVNLEVEFDVGYLIGVVWFVSFRFSIHNLQFGSEVCELCLFCLGKPISLVREIFSVCGNQFRSISEIITSPENLPIFRVMLVQSG